MRYQLLILSVALCAYSACLASEPSVPDSQTRDWSKYPAIAEIAKSPKDVYAVGDVHGDYDRLAELLLTAKLIAAKPQTPETADWSGGSAVLVSTGNLIDGYSQSLQVIALLRRLETQASKAGGRVIVTLGRDEADFLASDGSDTRTAEFSKELTAAGLKPADVVAGTDSAGIGAWMRNLPMGVKIGEWFYSHAGNTGDKTLPALETELRKEINENGFKAPILANPHLLIQEKLTPHPWWEDAAMVDKLKALDSEMQNDQARVASDKSSKNKKVAAAEKKNAAKTEQDEQKVKTEEAAARKEALGEPKLLAQLKALGAKHLVIGHGAEKVIFVDESVRTPGQMYTEFKGVVFFIDSGMSRGESVGGKSAILHVEHGTEHGTHSVTAIYSDGSPVSLLP